MSTRSARNLGIFLLLIVAVCGAVYARGVAEPSAVADALLPTPATAEEAPAARAAADSAVPAKPRRQIVPDVEVVVNIPSGRLELWEGDSVVRRYPVSVGSARYATPVGDYLLATVIWNPWWNPPPGSGWARNRRREPPGPRNPMGRVKLHMDELIYIHGTTSEGRLGAPASHGCIRMSNADVVDLARRLHRIAAPEVSDAELDALSKPGKNERHTVMARSIRMRVTYQVARLKGDSLRVLPDVYGKADFAAQVRSELARGGVDTSHVPAPAWTRLRQGAARGGATFALADIPSLVPLPPLPPAPPRESGPRLLGRPVGTPPPAETAAPAPPPTEPAPTPEPAPAPTPADPPAEQP